MKTLSIMGPLVLALAFGVIATFVGGCNPSTGEKDAGDFCEDACAVLEVCGEIRCDGPFGAPDESNCIDFLRDYSGLFITKPNELISFCGSLCNEISGEVEAVSTDCADALSDVWECNAETTTCPKIAPLPVLKNEDDRGGVFLPDIGDCEAETAVALEACEDANFD
ncbi:MAG: hypothetical protein VCB43_06795 [Myxococcota bacterium]